ncbi:hypothetical protein Sste5346_007887 [Sporothrix stenoceras]|uniref:Zn(2)-C6 fungal-type domain-containing protein n=1 Tax=Sporothrix stenoceras TaxID=5173 RepID=A0ABR3YSK1_9PEZI
MSDSDPHRTSTPHTAVPSSPAPTDSNGSYNPRKRGRTACTRCKNRKQKCDEQLPVCSNCRRAGADCDKADVASQPLPIAYTRALEDRVAQLEMLLERQAATPKEAQAVTSPSSVHGLTHGHPDSALSEVVGIISLGNFEAPAYVGPSAGLSLAVNLGEMVQATVWKKAIPDVFDPREAAETSPGGPLSTRLPRGGVRAMTKDEMARYSIKEPPSDALGTRLLHLYLSQPHSRYPFLQPADLWTLQREHTSSSVGVSSPHLTPSQRYGIFKLYMVYAIGATLLQLTNKNMDVAPERFYVTALQHMAAAREPRTVQNIEAMALLVIYHLRSASGLGTWYMIGLAMRTCIDLGMHRRSHEQGLSAASIHARRRLFWTVYALERNIAISLGRPLSLADRQIDVDLPRATLSAYPSSPGYDIRAVDNSDNIQRAILLFQLRRIESRIHHSVYRADKPLSTLRPKLDSLYTALEAWRENMTSTLRAIATNEDDADTSYLLLHYHRAVRTLIQPFLTILPASDPYLTRCLAAAGNICQSHKRLHQSLHYGHSFIAVQTIFVAGATLLYGLWTQTHRVWSVTLADDLRACSLVLFVMSERAPWVRKYRDAFELLVGATMQKLRSGGNDESAGGDLADMATLAQGQPVRPPPPEETRSDRQTSQSTQSGPTSTHPAEGGRDEDGDVWYLVKELANWIDQDPTQGQGQDQDSSQDKDNAPVWMPDFETLQNWTSFTPR